MSSAALFGNSRYSSGSYNYGNNSNTSNTYRNSSGNYGSSNNNNSSSNYTYGNNSGYNYNNNNNNGNNNGNSLPRLGTYRIDNYDHEKLSRSMSTLEQWKLFPPTSAAMREQTIHLTPVELRVEDYYLLRTGKIDDKASKGLKNWIGKKAFNEQLLNSDSVSSINKVLSFNQGPLKQETLVKAGGLNTVYGGIQYGNYNHNPDSTSYNSGGYNYGNNNNNNSSSNMFSSNYGNQNSNNPFTSNNNNNSGSNNPFSSSNNNNNSNNSNNMFSSNNNNNNNMFSSRNNNPFSSSNNNNNNNSYNNNNNNNPFNNNNNNNNNNSNNNPFSSNNNPFSSNNNNNNNNNNRGNPFSNNNNNNNSGNMFSSNNNNPFSNNNNNNNNNNSNNNPFANNNNNNNNPFNNNNNNNNNPFANNNNNNNNRNLFANNSNNLFANNNNNGNSNNLFNNNNNNNNGNNNNSNGLAITEYTVLQMMNMMQTCIDKLGQNYGGNPMDNTNGMMNMGFGKGTGFGGFNSDPYGGYSNNFQRRYKQWFKDPFEYDDYDTWKTKNETKSYIVVRDDGSNRVNNNNESLFRKDGSTFDKSRVLMAENDSMEVNQFNQFFQTEKISPNTTRDDTNRRSTILKHTASNLSMNHDTIMNNSFMSQKKSTRNNEEDHMFESNIKSRIIKNNQNNGFKYKYTISCIWNQDLRKPNFNYDQPERQIEGQISIKHSPSLNQLTSLIMIQILHNYGQRVCNDPNSLIRQDANLILELPIKINQTQTIIKGTLTQNKINISKDYDYIYDDLEGWNVTNLTFVGKHQRIHFPGTINIEGVNFDSELSIKQNQGQIGGKLKNYDMVITINNLPPKVMMQAHDERRANIAMNNHIQKAIQENGIKISLISMDLKYKNYTFKIQKQY